MINSNLDNNRDEAWMQMALQLAQQAAAQDEVPVGALIVHADQIIGKGYNRSIQLNDPTAHAEILALRAAAEKINNYRLPGTTLYVTLEPCLMCVGAMLHARVSRLVYGAIDPKTGVVGGALDLFALNRWNHTIQIESGILATECGKILQLFFQNKRAK